MKTIHFRKEQGRAIEAHGSAGAMAVRLLSSTLASVVAIYLEPGGLLGRHPAAADQLFLVVTGGGTATAEGQSCELLPGTAVFWRMGEEHETRAGTEGLVAIVAEGEDLAQAVTAT